MKSETNQLEALLESAQLLHGSLDLDALLKHLLRSIMGRFLVTKAVLTLSDGEVMRVAVTKGIKDCKTGEPFDTASCATRGLNATFPIGSAEQPVGFLAFHSASELGDEERNFVVALLGIAASGIENARAHAKTNEANVALARKVHDLSSLLELARGFTSALDPLQIANALGFTLAGRWALRKYAVVAWRDGETPVVRTKSVKLPEPAVMRNWFSTLESATTLDALPADAAEPLRAAGVVLAVPLRSGEKTVGVILLGSRGGGAAYTADDIDYIGGLADQATVALENAWLFRETLEKKKLEQELQLASDIQNRLLPASMPPLEHFDLMAKTRPARQVGGDYYDILPVSAPGPEHPHVVCVADVSGKGVGASLLMSNFQATLRALLTPDKPMPDIVARMNDLVHASTAANKYVTSIFAKVDPASGHVDFVNAGHNDGLVIRSDGSVDRMKACGLSVGLMPSRPYREGSLDLRAGDVMVLYSDGVTEANDPDENEFEDDRLIEVVRANADKPAADIISAIYEAVDGFAKTAPQYDDITVMVVKRLA